MAETEGLGAKPDQRGGEANRHADGAGVLQVITTDTELLRKARERLLFFADRLGTQVDCCADAQITADDIRAALSTPQPQAPAGEVVEPGWTTHDGGTCPYDDPDILVEIDDPLHRTTAAAGQFNWLGMKGRRHRPAGTRVLRYGNRADDSAALPPASPDALREAIIGIVEASKLQAAVEHLDRMIAVPSLADGFRGSLTEFRAGFGLACAALASPQAETGDAR